MADEHSTCYFDTFITVAPDGAAASGAEPVSRDSAAPSVAARTYALITAAPYHYTSDEVIFAVWADRHGIADDKRTAARADFFSKPQACLRSSDLGKRYGWGIHHDSAGRVALYACGTPEYDSFAAGISPLDGAAVTVRPALRSRR
jgi:hypothetical protein